MKRAIKAVLATLCDDYQLNRIYYLELPPLRALATPVAHGATTRIIRSADEYARSSDQRIRDHAWYFGERTYGVFEGEDLVCVCVFWASGDPRMPRRFSTIQRNEAVMVDLLTAAQCRGKGYAAAVTRYAENDLYAKGLSKLWTWVWHSNAPSLRVFAKTGWIYSHFLVELRLRGMTRALMVRLPPLGAR